MAEYRWRVKAKETQASSRHSRAKRGKNDKEVSVSGDKPSYTRSAEYRRPLGDASSRLTNSEGKIVFLTKPLPFRRGLIKLLVLCTLHFCDYLSRPAILQNKTPYWPHLLLDHIWVRLCIPEEYAGTACIFSP